MTPTFDPTDPETALDPYPAYAALRDAGPVWYSPAMNLHFITRHADVHEAWRDRRLGSDFGDRPGFDAGAQPWRSGDYPAFARFERWDLLAIEPPDHTMLRRLVLTAFTPRAVEAQRARIDRSVEAALEAAGERGSLDIVRDLAEPLSLGVICDLIGVPEAERAGVIDLSHAVVAMYEPDPAATAKARADEAAGEFLDLVHALIADRRADSADDLLTALTVAEAGGRRLDDDQIASTAMVLLMAGHEASVNAAANGVAAFARHPAEWQAVVSGAVRPAVAIEEVLRWDPPLQYFHRWVLDDGITIGGPDGIAIPRGQRVALMIGSANRDGRRFDEPDAFRAGRGETAHLSFGGGIHFCLGAPLARLELEVLFAALARRFRRFELLEGVERRAGFQFRGYSRLPIAVDDVHDEGPGPGIVGDAGR
ncbi:MAG: cytochrome P450 [Chloroflexota bacterium]|nr:MAG: cytochrome P450 [Chloroflexota bacterium]